MRGLGLVVAVSITLIYGYAIVETEGRVNQRVALSDLKRDEVVFPVVAQSYETRTERVAYGVWDEVHSLVPVANVMAVAA